MYDRNKIKTEFIKSSSDNLKIEIAYTIPKGEIKGIVQISHGMSEHKERYFKFMEYLSENGYVCIINDHRGHGNSVKDKTDLGYFYTENTNFIIDDLQDVTLYIKNKYPNYKIYLFSHSMGTLVARGYMQKYDNEIEKIVLCGTPTKNEFTVFAIAIAYLFKFIGFGKKPNKILNTLTFKAYNKNYKLENEWLSKNPNNISIYNDDELCGFIFTTNGFINLYKLLKRAFNEKLYKVQNKNLEIFLIAGDNDPVIQNTKKFKQLEQFLNKLGYKNTKSKLYPDLRHEILNEEEYEQIYKDILDFFINNKEK